MERGSIPIHLGLLLWILTSAPAVLSQSAPNVCTNTRTIHQFADDKCSAFIDYVIDGFSLNKTKTFPGKSAQEINTLLTNPDPNLQCYFFKKIDEKYQACCDGWVSSVNGSLTCDIPQCSPACQNGGNCTEPPNVCSCPAAYTGYRCEDKISDTSSTAKFCYSDHYCGAAKVDKYYNQVVSQADCCTNGGKGWGVGRDSCTVCANANTTVPDTSVVVQTNELAFKTCLNFGPSYYRTFDGLEYEYGGMCTYTLLKDIDKGWKVELTPKNCAKVSECTKRVTMFLGSGETISVEAGQVKVNDMDFILSGEEPKSTPENTYNVRNMSGWIFVDSAKGLSIKVDSKSTVELTVYSDKVQGDVKFQGLCGNLNRDPSDEFKTSSGSLSSSPVYFANSWQVVNSVDGCSPAGYMPNYCRTPEDEQAAADACALINTLLHPCHTAINPKMYYTMCKNMHCRATTDDERNQVRCQYANAYSQECAAINIVMKWRSKYLCPRECPAPLEYSECTSSCPRTCKTLYLVEPDECKMCISGCQCPVGTFLQNGQCVKPDECMCEFNKKQYKHGDTIKQRCNLCTCDRGRWTCEEDRCSSSCEIVGLNHVATFDGNRYSFAPDSCSYTLVEPDSNIVDDNERANMTIKIKMDKCTDFQDVNCIGSVTLTYQSAIIKLEGEKLFINHVDYSETIRKTPYSFNGLYVKEVTNKFRVVKAFGLKILYDKKRTLYIDLKPFYANKVRGMCGQFNYDITDDFKVPNGGEQATVQNFATAYGDSTCQTGVYSYNMEMEEKHEACYPLMNTTRGALFADCIQKHEELSKFYYAQCNYDMKKRTTQVNMEALCDIVSAFSRHCTFSGLFVPWYNDSAYINRCESYLSCTQEGSGAGSVYTDCAKICHGTCRDQQLADANCEEECVPGCMCPTGQVQDDYGTCVNIERCTCYDQYSPKENRIKKAGDVVSRRCTDCTCSNGTFACGKESCEEQIVCPKNQVYRKGVTACRKTCELYGREMICDSDVLMDGCVCDESNNQTAYMAPDGTCVSSEQCPCLFGTMWYKPGETVTYGCKVFRCENQNWIKIEDKHCPAVCRASGDPHYTTFDGVSFSFQGVCSYILTRAKDKSFQVITENVKCGSTDVSCTKSIQITIKGQEINLVRGKDDVNTTGDIYQLSNIIITKQSFWTSIHAPSENITILWDGGTRVYVFLKPIWQGRVEGLCGNYDGDSVNEYKKVDGSEGTAMDFANSWAASTSCPVASVGTSSEIVPCSGELSHRKQWAEESCGIINSDIFKSCREFLTDTVVNRYHANCLFDACRCDSGGDCECFCTAVADFAERCNQAGYPVKWRSQKVCPIMCENGFRYTPCASPCPQTCRNIGDEPEPYCNDTQCVEGCFCPEGYVQRDERCVLAEDCPCYYNGQEWPKGASIIKDCLNCTCINGKFHCSGENCTVCKDNEFTCNRTGDCIKMEYRCDNHVDCRDGSDEQGCEYKCKVGQFQCANLNKTYCVDSNVLCDGMRDCINGEDELNCTYTCAEHEFTCESGKCIPKTFKCDGNMDCGVGDNSDEKDCGETECTRVRNFRCGATGGGLCLPITLKCDKHDDCGDGSDEIGCNCTCSSAEFTCSSSCECIDPSKRCDGVLDCGDGSDEMECPCTLNEYTCDNEKCINGTQHCDGVYDCTDQSDEKNCATTTPATETTPIISSTLTTFTPCVSGEIMSNPAALPSTKIYINPQPISPYTAENLRPGSTAPLEINSNTATISMDLTTTDNPDGSVIKSLNIVGDQSNVEKISVSYKVTPTSTSQDFTSFTGIGPVTFPDNFKVAAVDVTLLQRTDSSQPYKIKLEVVACIHGVTPTTTVPTTVTTPCADAMLDTSPSVVGVTISGFPTTMLATDIFSSSGVLSMPGSVTPVTVDLTFKTPQPPKVTDFVFTLTNGKDIEVTFTDENGSTRKLNPDPTPNGRIILDFNGQPSLGITIKATPSSTTESLTIKETEVKACSEIVTLPPLTTPAPPTPSTTTPLSTPTPSGETTPISTVCTEEMLTPTDLSVMSVDSPSFPSTDLPNLFTSVGVVSNTPTTTAEIVVTFNTASPPRVTTVTTTVTKATSVVFTLLDEDNNPIQTQTKPVTKVTETPVTATFGGVPGKKVKIVVTKTSPDVQTSVKNTEVKACTEITQTTTPSVTTTVIVPTTSPVPSEETTPLTTVCTEEMLTPTDLSVMSVDSPSFPTTDLPNLFTSVGVVSNTLTTTAEIVVTFNTASPPRVTTVTTTVTKATSVEFTLLDEDDTPIQTQTKPVTTVGETPVTATFSGVPGKKSQNCGHQN